MDKETIMELQRMLRTLSFSDNRLIPLVVDGIYGVQTRDAVRIFQDIYRLPPTGEIDHRTWEAIRNAYRAVEHSPARPLMPFPHPDFVLRPGETDELSLVIAYILNRLSQQYPNIPPVRPSERYDPDLEEAIRYIQTLHGLETNGVIDRVTWDLLATLFNNRRDPLRG